MKSLVWSRLMWIVGVNLLARSRWCEGVKSLMWSYEFIQLKQLNNDLCDEVDVEIRKRCAILFAQLRKKQRMRVVTTTFGPPCHIRDDDWYSVWPSVWISGWTARSVSTDRWLKSERDFSCLWLRQILASNLNLQAEREDTACTWCVKQGIEDLSHIWQADMYSEFFDALNLNLNDARALRMWIDYCTFPENSSRTCCHQCALWEKARLCDECRRNLRRCLTN